MTIEFVSESTVSLVKSNAKDYDVALAAWVSNYDSSELEVREPANYKFKGYQDALNELARGSLAWTQELIDEYYADVIKYNTRVGGLINFLYRERHMSPFEHGSMTFLIDTPIFVAREFMRHRTWSYNETSGRYKELNPRFYLIGEDRPVQQKGKVGAYEFDPGTDLQYGVTYAATQVAYSTAWTQYQMMLNNGVAREVARNVLPVGIMTQFYATANPRNIMQFLTLRNDKNALHEIRQVAVGIEEQFARAMPLTYAAYKKYDWRTERDELTLLRKQVKQLEAEATYADNIQA